MVNLKNWFKDYRKSRDAFKLEITSIKDSKDFDLVIEKSKGKEAAIIKPILNNLKEDLEKFSKEDLDRWFIITLNNENNFKYLLDNWINLIQYKKLCIYFVNPYSRLEKKWIIFPFSHSLISERDVEKGLRSLFETVSTLSLKEYQKLE